MKKILVVAAAALLMAGCNRDNTVNESARAQKDAVKANADAQKDALNAQKDAVSKQAKEQKDQIDAQAKADKEQINAKKDEVDAQAKAAKAEADANAKAANAQGKALNESAGAATTTTADNGNSDSLIKAKVRAAILGNSADSSNPASVSANPNAPQNLNVDVSNGKVTLKGDVANDQARMDAEQRAKSVAGVTAVDNRLEIKANK